MKFLSALFGLTLTIGLFSNTAFAAPCNVSDVKAYNSDNSGPVSSFSCVNSPVGDKNDSASDITSLFTGTWIQLAKTPDDFYQDDTISGNWDFSSVLSDISNPFIIVIKSSAEYAAYYFNIFTNGKGTFTTAGLTPNKKGKDQGVSHISLYTTDSISPVPVPAAAWLMAPVFAGFMLRKRNA